ncbi:MAG: hypothetical protein AAF417_21745 [Pseudomonadota bacterium]
MSEGHVSTLRNLLRGRSRWTNITSGLLLIVAGYAAIAIPTWNSSETLGQPHLISGYSLLGLMVALALFNVRKRLPMLPLIKTRWWTFVHVCGGLLAVAAFWLHTSSLWPKGLYEQLLAAAFYLTALSGIVGVLLQRLQPSRLTQAGAEVIYERIPNELAQLRRQAEDTALQCARDTGHETLARYFVESLQWYFCAPRFVASYIRGAGTAEFWLEQHFATVRRYLNDEERRYLARIEALAEQKSAIDSHYAGQLMLRGWLMVHVPCVAAVLLLSGWHVLLVHIYAL